MTRKEVIRQLNNAVDKVNNMPKDAEISLTLWLTEKINALYVVAMKEKVMK